MDNKRGFTLIEVMIVICLFALVATLGMVQFSFLDSTIARIEVDKLANVCLFLQQDAITTNSEKVLTCDAKNNEYRSFDGLPPSPRLQSAGRTNGVVHEKLSQRISFGFVPGVLGSPGSPTHRIEKAITFPGSLIHFYPTGIISSGTAYLVDEKKQCMYALSNAVSQVSYLRLYRYVGRWKLL